MKKLWLSERMISTVFWAELTESLYTEEAVADAKKIAVGTALLVDRFPSVAGSISLDSSMYLWLLSKYFSPKNICEIGTYIGRSTLTMAFGGSSTLENIYTCDGTYDCMSFDGVKIDYSTDEKRESVKKIRYMGKTMSTDMLKKLKEEGITVDFMFIDGRLGAEDCSLITDISSEDCVLVLDDFDGVEKGVLNAVMLRGTLRGHILLAPPVLKSKNRVLNMAILVPSKILSLSRQQALPVNM